MAARAERERFTEAALLAAVEPGRDACRRMRPRYANDVQRRLFRDPEMRLALRVLQHFLLARDTRGDDAPFPLAGETFAAVSRRAGMRVGVKRARRMLKALLAADAIQRAGSYRKPYTNEPGAGSYRIPLYRTTMFALRSSVSALRAFPKRPTGRRGRVKPWWRHPLFGLGVDTYPGSFPRRLRNWKEPPEWSLGGPMIFVQKGAS